jgi:acetyltransferase
MASQAAAFKLLEIFDIPHPACALTRGTSEASAAAKAIGFPVVLKIDSPDIVHKTDVGGVHTGLQTVQEVKEAFEDINRKVLRHHPEASINGIFVQSMSGKPLLELICGLKRDPVFGSILLLGMGGIMVEILGDVSMRVAPVSTNDTHQMWKELSGARLLEGFRGRPKADTDALEELLQKVALLSESVPEILEMDLNPVMMMEAGSGLSVVDCRIILDRKKA